MWAKKICTERRKRVVGPNGPPTGHEKEKTGGIVADKKPIMAKALGRAREVPRGGGTFPDMREGGLSEHRSFMSVADCEGERSCMVCAKGCNGIQSDRA